MKNQSVKRTVMIVLTSLLLVGCAKAEAAPSAGSGNDVNPGNEEKTVSDTRSEYDYIPGTYTRRYTEEIGDEPVEIQETVVLNADHTCSVTFQDTVTGEWNGIMLTLDDGTEFEFTVEGPFLYINLNDEWIEFENVNNESANNDNTGEAKEVHYIYNEIDIENLPDGTYPVRLFFDDIKRNTDSLTLDFMIYNVVHYDPEDINSLTRGDIIYEYVDETTTANYVVDTVNFPVDTVCVINGGSERGEGLTLSLDESGFYRVSVDEGYTRNSARGVVRMEIPDSVTFEDNHKLDDAKFSGQDLYDYFNGLGETERDYFNENSTFITITGGKITGFNRIYLP